MVDTVSLELMCVRSNEDFVARDLGGDDLADDVFVGEADDEAEFGSVVFVLGLRYETLASKIVGLTRSATLVLDLIAAVGRISSSVSRSEIHIAYLK